jgi:hypothetical protein
MKDNVTPMEKDRFQRVKDAYETLLAGGYRPTQDRVLGMLHARHGQAVSLRDLVPIVRYLNAQRVSAASVARVVKGYAALDVVQREAAMALMKTMEWNEPDVRQVGLAPPVGNMQEAEGGEA